MKAIYKVIENGHTSYFRSGIAGGYSYPLRETQDLDIRM